MRMGGLGSGIDTDQMVKDMMKIEQAKIDKVKGQKVYKEWQQTAYRDMIKAVNELKSKYFDILKKDTYLKSPSTFASNRVKSSDEESVFVKNVGTVGNYSRTVKVLQKAENATLESGVLKASAGGLVASDAFDKAKLKDGFAFSVAVDGEVKTIRLKKDLTGEADNTKIAEEFNKLFEEAYGMDRTGQQKVKMEINAGKIGISLSNELVNSKLEVMDIFQNGGIASLGYTGFHKVSNRFDVNQTVKDLMGSEDSVTFKINNKEFTFTKDQKISDIIKEINNSDAGVTIRYDGVDDKLKIDSKASGTASTITIEDGAAGFLSKLKVANGTQRGKDAVVELNGQTVYRSSNSFTIDGVSYEIKKADPSKSINVTVNSDTESAIKAIKSFVEDYNALIKGVNTRLVEKKYRSFTPLTDEQRSAMAEKDVKLWEEKAKSGILRSDPLLRDMMSDLRLALSTRVNGIGLSDIGITTSTDYKENGKLEINEIKLKEALESKGTEIAELFTAPPSEGGKVKGLAYLLEDIINKNVGTVGEKGILLKKAGMEGDRTVKENAIEEEIDEYEKRIQVLMTRMADKEEQLYSRFSKLETMMSKLNQQSSWLAQQLGGGK